MITKYNKYNLIQEKSILNFLKVDNKLIKNVYSNLPLLKDNFYSSEFDLKDFDFKDISYEIHFFQQNEAILLKLKYDIELFIIRDINVNKNNYYSNNIENDKVIIYDNFNYGSMIYHYQDLINMLKIIYDRNEFLNMYLLYDIYHKPKKDNHYLHYEDINKLFNEKYKEFLIKIYNSYIIIFNDLLIKYEDNFKYTDEINSDISYLKSTIDKRLDITFNRHTYNDIIKKYADENGYMIVKSDDYDLINKILRDLLIYTHHRICVALDFFKYHKWENELKKNPSYYKIIKHSINNPEFLKEWEFLEQSNNFDLL